MMKSNKCFVFAISLSLMFSIAFALIEVWDCSLSDPKDPYSFPRVTDAVWGVDSDGSPSVTITVKGPTPIQAINDFKIAPAIRPINEDNVYYRTSKNADWVNGYHDYMFEANNTYVGKNPFKMSKTISTRSFPPSGTWVFVGATVYFNCHPNNDDSELVCNMCTGTTVTRQVP